MALGGFVLAAGIAEILLHLLPPPRLIGPVLTRYDPVYGKRLKASSSGVLTTPEFSTRITMNSLGFRGPEPEGPPTPSVVFLGDSFTFGFGVSDGDEYPQLVARTLVDQLGTRSPAVVNAGIGDVGNGHWVKFLRREASAHDPAAVVFQVCQNDWVDNRREGLFMLDDSNGLTELAVPRQSLARRAQRGLEKIPFLMSTRLVNHAKLALVRGQRGSPTQAPELTRALIAESLEMCSAQGWPAMVVTANVCDDKLSLIRELCSEHGVPLVVGPSCDENTEFRFPVDKHWNEAGHALVADKVTELLLGGLLADARSQGGTARGSGPLETQSKHGSPEQTQKSVPH
jgi:hypothetical protein